MGVSKYRGTHKSSILIGFSIINHPFWGTLIFGNTHILSYTYCLKYRNTHYIRSLCLHPVYSLVVFLFMPFHIHVHFHPFLFVMHVVICLSLSRQGGITKIVVLSLAKRVAECGIHWISIHRVLPISTATVDFFNFCLNALKIRTLKRASVMRASFHLLQQWIMKVNIDSSHCEPGFRPQSISTCFLLSIRQLVGNHKSWADQLISRVTNSNFHPKKSWATTIGEMFFPLSYR